MLLLLPVGMPAGVSGESVYLQEIREQIIALKGEVCETDKQRAVLKAKRGFLLKQLQDKEEEIKDKLRCVLKKKYRDYEGSLLEAMVSELDEIKDVVDELKQGKDFKK